jgi:hypothetical protein
VKFISPAAVEDVGEYEHRSAVACMRQVFGLVRVGVLCDPRSQRRDRGHPAREWFEVMRRCGDEVREILHDGCPVACLGDAPFGYVNVFTSHVNVGFFHGAALPDPDHLLQGSGKFMRHVKLRPGTVTDASSLRKLIEMAYSDIKARVENG